MRMHGAWVRFGCASVRLRQVRNDAEIVRASATAIELKAAAANDTALAVLEDLFAVESVLLCHTASLTRPVHLTCVDLTDLGPLHPRAHLSDTPPSCMQPSRPQSQSKLRPGRPASSLTAQT